MTPGGRGHAPGPPQPGVRASDDPWWARTRRGLGVVPQDVALPGNLTGKEMVEFVFTHFPGGLASGKDYREVLRSWGLEGFCSKRIKNLPGGQSRRIAVGLAFVGSGAGRADDRTGSGGAAHHVESDQDGGR